MSIVILFVESKNACSERRFQKSTLIGVLKQQLEPIVGISSDSQILRLQSATTNESVELTDDDAPLGRYPAENGMVLQVTSTTPGAQLEMDVSQVEKYVMDDPDYDRRRGTVRAFKRQHNLGRFADNKSAMSLDEEDEFKQEAAKIKVGDRCEVTVPGSDLGRRGVVRFVGKTAFRSGYWVGVEYDEPLGMNDGSVDGTRYFECQAGHGSFVQPDKVAVGDYPEEDLFASDLEEM